jgi:hypothetical protein
VSRYVVGSFAVVRTLGEPALDGLAVCGRVVVVTTLEAKPANQSINQSINHISLPHLKQTRQSINQSYIITELEAKPANQ